jgi:pimeloyl-ACP methyl ester carboxylesterase
VPSDSSVIAVTRGDGPDVVLVHGALGDHRQWAPIAEALESAFRVTAISRRYHWPHPPPPDDGKSYTYIAQAHDLRAFLQSLGRPAHLVGHSWGAGVALLTALAEGIVVRSLVLIEPAFGSLIAAGPPELQAELASRSALMNDISGLVRAGDDDAAARALVAWLQDSERGFEDLPEEARNGLLANAKTIGPTFSAPPPHVTCDRLRELDVPALVLHGARTRMFYRLVAEHAAGCLPNVQIQVIPACGHMSIVENPAAVASLLRDFLVQN